jgi:uncharacterized delta-60 repeat protein
MKAVRKLAAIVVAVALFALPAVASAKGGVDRSFGRHGRVIARLPGTMPGGPRLAGLARAPRGRIVAALSLPSTLGAAGSALVIRYRPNGRPDQAFGNHGRVEVPGSRLAPDASFQPSDVAVDSHGRVLLAGTVSERCFPACHPWRSLLAVVRLRPDGRIDRRFGHDGVTVTGFGLPGPEPLGLFPIDLRPAVTGARILVKRRGAIVVAGTVSVRIAYAGRPLPSNWYAPLLARLTPNGHRDLRFGSGGVTVLASLAHPRPNVNALAVDSRGRISAAVCATDYGGTLVAGKLGVLRLLGDGAPDLSYGPGGLRETTECPRSMAIDPYRRTLVLLGPSGEAFTGEVAPATLERWRASGLPDRRFGRGGRVAPPVRHGHPTVWQDVLAGRRGRVALGGMLARTERPGLPGLAGFRLLATKLARTGRPDRRFGRRGQRSSGIGAKSSFAFPGQARALLDGRGRVVVATVIAYGEYERAPLFLSMVRYLAGHSRR